MTTMNEREALERIRRTITESGESMRSWAKRWKVSAAFLSDVLSGKRHIGPKLAKACGWRVTKRVTVTCTFHAPEPAQPRKESASYSFNGTRRLNPFAR